ncbi:hypothetical protein WA026_000024 [Henosepilachna vigintioctopunctata]|uniref:Major facilitator superfamily (MFS) profile domain-containing protein n=1 Tax=Henosepilachna vigintioctopunctata TaxID=420089 RepID=A0AAW1V4H5_9CUCU
MIYSSPWQIFANILGSGYTVFIVLIAYISNLIAGVSFVWSSPTLVKLNETENNPLGKPITPNESDLIGSLFYIGAAIGPLLFMESLERLGRKPTMIIMGIPLPIAYGMLSLTGHIEVYYICRVVLGLVVGAICSITSVYASEILPANIRGSLMSLSNCFIQGGSLLTYFIGPYLSIMAFNMIIAGISLIFVVLFILSCPETPYYLMQKKGREKSKDILMYLRKDGIEAELKDIEDSVREEISSSYLELFKSKRYFKAFLMATLIMIIQQLTGITMVMGYSQLIFSETNIQISSEKCSIIVGCLQVASSFITPLLSERIPRKVMWCSSLFGLSICNFCISLYFFVLKGTRVVDWLPLVTLILFVICDNCGNGPLPWVLLGEIYPMQVRSVGPLLSTSIYYFVQFFLTFSFNKIEQKYMFFGYGWCCIFGLLYVRYFVTETRGKSLKEIQESLEDITENRV